MRKALNIPLEEFLRPFFGPGERICLRIFDDRKTGTFKGAKRAAKAIAALPLEQIVLETDCPYMAPEPNRGRRNSSLNLPYVAEALAQIKGITAEEVIAVTEENAKRLLFRA